MAQGSAALLDLGTSGGEWVYTQNGMLFGPAPAASVIELLMAGEVDGTTPIGREGEAMRPLGEVPFFRGHIPRAEARRREREQQRAQARIDQRRRRLRAAVWVGAGGLGGIGLAAALALALRAPRPDEGALAGVDVEISPPRIEAVAEKPGEDLVDYVEGQKAPAARPAAAHLPTAPQAHAAGEAPAADGMAVETRYDRSAIDSALRTQQSLLFPCLREAAKADASLRGEVPFSFTIGNDGHVAKVWVDRPGYEEGPLLACLKDKASRMRFSSFEGERPTVSLSFHVR